MIIQHVTFHRQSIELNLTSHKLTTQILTTSNQN